MGMPAGTTVKPTTMDTDQVAPAERPGFWADCIARLFSGLKSDLYGDAGFDGRMATLHAGDVVLTRLEANRHRVMRSSALARRPEVEYLKMPVARHRAARGAGDRAPGGAHAPRRR